MPRISTPSVCDSATAMASTNAWILVPLVPTRYAPITVLPWPGASECSAPRNAAKPSAIIMAPIPPSALAIRSENASPASSSPPLSSSPGSVVGRVAASTSADATKSNVTDRVSGFSDGSG